MDNLHVKWWQLSADEIVVLVSSVILLPSCLLLTKRANFLELLGPSIPSKSSNVSLQSKEKARRFGVIVNKVTTVFVGQGTCLLRSVILQKLLLRRGFPRKICLGVLPNQMSFEAHAWVEVNGFPVNDALDVAQKYRPFGTPNLYEASADL